MKQRTALGLVLFNQYWPLAAALNFTDRVGFVLPQRGGYRDTLGIMWPCLSTIVLCVYTTLHLDIPPRALNRSQTLLRTVGWIVMGILIPEITCTKAILDRYHAMLLKRRWNTIAYSIISLKQAQFLLAGGIHAQFPNPVKGEYTSRKSTAKLENRCLKCFAIGPLLYWSSNDFKFNLATWLQQHLPTDEDINQLGNADLLVKTITIFQAGWAAASIVSRLVRHIDISLLEVVTMAQIILAFIAYLCWFPKPYDIALSRQTTLPEHLGTALARMPGYDYVAPSCHAATPLQDALLKDTEVYAVRWMDPCSRTYEWDRAAFFMEQLPMIATALVFGAVHCASWRYSFATPVEAVLWHTAALVMSTFLALFVTQVWWFGDWHSVSSPIRPAIKAVLSAVQGFLMLGYILARVYVLVEVFLAFRSAPAGIYKQLQWSSFFAHIDD